MIHVLKGIRALVKRYGFFDGLAIYLYLSGEHFNNFFYNRDYWE